MATFSAPVPLHIPLICALMPLFLLATADAQEALTPTYHSAASEVRLVLFVTDQNGHAVEDLQQDDFAVVDDERVIRNFRSFTRSTAMILDLVVLIDTSASVRSQFQREIADVMQLLSQWPWSPEGNVSVLSFGGLDVRILCSGDCRSSPATDRIASLQNGGSATPLFDAIEVAAGLLAQRKQPDVWPVILLFSDGEDTISLSSFDHALEQILTSGAQVYAIDSNSPGTPWKGAASKGRATLQRIADDSGGRCVPLSEDAGTIFNDVIGDLHSARIVTYSEPKSGSNYHSVRILPTHNLNLQFRSRRGYYRRPGCAQ
jgi:VWFA-related protein